MNSIIVAIIVAVATFHGVVNGQAWEDDNWKYVGDYDCDPNFSWPSAVPKHDNFKACIAGCAEVPGNSYVYAEFDTRPSAYGNCYCFAHQGCKKIPFAGVQMYVWKNSGAASEWP